MGGERTGTGEGRRGGERKGRKRLEMDGWEKGGNV